MNRSPLYASLQWLKEHEAISDEDIVIFNEIKKRRNALAHELIHSSFTQAKLVAATFRRGSPHRLTVYHLSFPFLTHVYLTYARGRCFHFTT